MAEHRFNKKSSIECCLWGLFFSSRCCNSLQPAGKGEVESERKRERARTQQRELEIWYAFQIDTGLSKYYLLLGWCWSITWHFSILLFSTSSTVSPVWYCDRADADQSPWLSADQPAVRQELICVLGNQRCKREHAFDNWEMRPSSLYLCIQAALCCSHYQWQQMEQRDITKFCMKSQLLCPKSDMWNI